LKLKLRQVTLLTVITFMAISCVCIFMFNLTDKLNYFNIGNKLLAIAAITSYLNYMLVVKKFKYWMFLGMLCNALQFMAWMSIK
jgi:hypothetical protein